MLINDFIISHEEVLFSKTPKITAADSSHVVHNTDFTNYPPNSDDEEAYLPIQGMEIEEQHQSKDEDIASSLVNTNQMSGSKLTLS